MQLTLADDRPAHLTRVHAALTALPHAGQARPGVTEDWETGPHQLTCRQAGHTFSLAVQALSKDEPDGAPSPGLAAACDEPLEASIPAGHKDASAALSADWTDTEAWSRPPRHGTTGCADPGSRPGAPQLQPPRTQRGDVLRLLLPGRTMTAEETGPPVPELARRMTLTSCHLDPARALVPVLTRMPAAGIPLGDVLADSGYAHRDAEARASCAPPARSWPGTCTRTTADRGEPTRARLSPTDACTARPRRNRC